MTTSDNSDVERLLQRAQDGDSEACATLLEQHRDSLRQLIQWRMDRRVMTRVDPSDVVQETLTEAFEQLPNYLRRRPLPFYLWLRQLALDRIGTLYRRHVQAQKRSVTREQDWPSLSQDDSARGLAERLVSQESSPSTQLQLDELRARVREALAQLAEHDREILVLRHLEQLSTREISVVLGIAEQTVYTRHLRALEKLRDQLGDELREDLP